eukprot:GFYU01001325.1.p1 GENE.GFYU01001325.1~~GFYU01001325.1.p1  ORF type:complete len:778 (-),score=210.61 GFYU01001325.1:105-2438(-)
MKQTLRNRSSRSLVAEEESKSKTQATAQAPAAPQKSSRRYALMAVTLLMTVGVIAFFSIDNNWQAARQLTGAPLMECTHYNPAFAAQGPVFACCNDGVMCQDPTGTQCVPCAAPPTNVPAHGDMTCAHYDPTHCPGETWICCTNANTCQSADGFRCLTCDTGAPNSDKNVGDHLSSTCTHYNHPGNNHVCCTELGSCQNVAGDGCVTCDGFCKDDSYCAVGELCDHGSCLPACTGRFEYFAGTATCPTCPLGEEANSANDGCQNIGAYCTAAPVVTEGGATFDSDCTSDEVGETCTATACNLSTHTLQNPTSTCVADTAESGVWDSAPTCADVTAPDTTITPSSTPPLTQDPNVSGRMVSGNTQPAFEFTADEASTFECRIYDVVSGSAPAFAACSSGAFPTAPLADGTYVFEVRAVDGASNIDATPASFGPWEVDATAPIPTTMTVRNLQTGNDGGLRTGHIAMIVLTTDESKVAGGITVTPSGAGTVNISQHPIDKYRWSLTFPMVAGDTEGPVSFSIDCCDIVGNCMTMTQADTTDNSSIAYDPDSCPGACDTNATSCSDPLDGAASPDHTCGACAGGFAGDGETCTACDGPDEWADGHATCQTCPGNEIPNAAHDGCNAPQTTELKTCKCYNTGCWCEVTFGNIVPVGMGITSASVKIIHQRLDNNSSSEWLRVFYDGTQSSQNTIGGSQCGKDMRTLRSSDNVLSRVRDNNKLIVAVDASSSVHDFCYSSDLTVNIQVRLTVATCTEGSTGCHTIQTRATGGDNVRTGNGNY